MLASIGLVKVKQDDSFGEVGIRKTVCKTLILPPPTFLIRTFLLQDKFDDVLEKLQM